MRPPELHSPDEIRAPEAVYGLRARRGIVAGFLILAVALSLFYLPISTGIPIPHWFWHIHMQSPTCG